MSKILTAEEKKDLSQWVSDLKTKAKPAVDLLLELEVMTKPMADARHEVIDGEIKWALEKIAFTGNGGNGDGKKADGKRVVEQEAEAEKPAMSVPASKYFPKTKKAA